MNQQSVLAGAARPTASTPVRPPHVLVAVVFAVLLVLVGGNPWWMLPLAAVAAPLGLANGGGRLGVLAMAVGVAAGAAAVLAGWADLRDVLVTAARGVVTGALPWSVALAWRARRAAEVEAALTLLREQDAQRLRAETDLARQRLHLAESLHDDLGHALSLVAVNLGRLELELERDEGSPEGGSPASSARSSVALARRQVSDAVARLGASVQTLRTGDTEDGGLPSATDHQAAVDGLVLEARRAGAEVTLSGSPGRQALAPFGPDVVRVVREGLTNALRHAPGRPVRIELGLDAPSGLVVTISNPLPPPTGSRKAAENPVREGGTGLRSLTEQVEGAGGSVTAGPEAGFHVLRATLRATGGSAGSSTSDPGPASPPVDAASAPAGHGPLRDVRAVTHGFTQARRRGGMLLVAAVLVSASLLVVVATAIQLADNLDARRSLLGPAAFAEIGVGDARSAVRPLLPGATLERPPGADPSCDYYAVTADPLADASGDAYRICWTDGRVASADLVVGGAP